MPPRPGAPPFGSGARIPAVEPAGRSLAAARHQPRPANASRPGSPDAVPGPAHPRPMYGMVVAVMVMNCTLASSGRPAMNITASAAC
jgi:hypothetical protein